MLEVHTQGPPKMFPFAHLFQEAGVSLWNITSHEDQAETLSFLFYNNLVNQTRKLPSYSIGLFHHVCLSDILWEAGHQCILGEIHSCAESPAPKSAHLSSPNLSTCAGPLPGGEFHHVQVIVSTGVCVSGDGESAKANR